MKTHIKLQILAVLALLLLTACDKMKAEKLAGTYVVTYHHFHSYFPNPEETIDTTYYNVEVEVIQQDKELVIGVWHIPVDEVRRGKKYEEEGREIYFSDNEIHYHYHNASYNSSTTISYSGPKKE